MGELTEEIQQKKASIQADTLSSIATVIEQTRTIINTMPGLTMTQIISDDNIPADKLRKILDEVSFKGSIASMHINGVSSILLPSIEQLNKASVALLNLADLAKLEFQKKYVECYYEDTGFNNVGFKASVKTILDLK